MGTNTIPSATSGTTIPASHHNAIKSALAENLVPRNTAGNATDLAGSFGSSTYRWLAGFFRRLFIGTASSSSNNIKIHRGGNQLMQILPGDDTTDDGVEATTIAQLDSRVINKTSLGGAGNAGRIGLDTLYKNLNFDDGSTWHRTVRGNYWLGSPSGVINPVTTTWADIANNSFTITSTGLPLFFTFIVGKIILLPGTGSLAEGLVQIRLLRDTTQVGIFEVRIPEYADVPASIFSFFEVPPATTATYVYKTQVRTSIVNQNSTVASMVLLAKEF